MLKPGESLSNMHVGVGPSSWPFTEEVVQNEPLHVPGSFSPGAGRDVMIPSGQAYDTALCLSPLFVTISVIPFLPLHFRN